MLQRGGPSGAGGIASGIRGGGKEMGDATDASDSSPIKVRQVCLRSCVSASDAQRSNDVCGGGGSGGCLLYRKSACIRKSAYIWRGLKQQNSHLNPGQDVR